MADQKRRQARAGAERSAVSDQDATMVTESTPVEDSVHRALSGIFATLLGIAPKDIGPRTSFLQLGADSLLLMQASQAVHDKLSVRVPFRDLLVRYKNVEDLGRFIIEKRGTNLPDLNTITGNGHAEDTEEATGQDRVSSARIDGGAVQSAPSFPGTDSKQPRESLSNKLDAKQLKPAEGVQESPAAEMALCSIVLGQLEVMRKQLEILQRSGLPVIEGASRTLASRDATTRTKGHHG